MVSSFRYIIRLPDMISPESNVRLEQTRLRVAARVRELRQSRRWTQAELSAKLGMSQARLSEIERGAGSFAAEQLVEVLRLFNVDLSDFVPPSPPDAVLQNALARLGALHLRERDDVLPTARLRDVVDAVRETLVSPCSSRLVAALAPVIVWNINVINLDLLHHQLVELGLSRRLGWLIENIATALDAISKPAMSEWGRRQRRAKVVLAQFIENVQQLPSPEQGGAGLRLDHFDSDIRSRESLDEVWLAVSLISRKWQIVTSLQPQDFEVALRAADAPD